MRRMTALLACGLALVATATLAAEYRATAPDARKQLDAMMALYDGACLRAFPDDAAVAKLMAARGATPLDEAGVRALLHDDPGVGWQLQAAGARFDVTVELPPYHACSVRTMTADGFAGLSGYRTLADAYEQARPGFAPISAAPQAQGDIRTVFAAEGRLAESGATELLIMASATVTDETQRKAGQTATEVRFVHQLVMPAGEGHPGPAS